VVLQRTGGFAGASRDTKRCAATTTWTVMQSATLADGMGGASRAVGTHRGGPSQHTGVAGCGCVCFVAHLPVSR
jgi:hypothetical protein